jgi:hypothetical protein
VQQHDRFPLPAVAHPQLYPTNVNVLKRESLEHQSLLSQTARSAMLASQDELTTTSQQIPRYPRESGGSRRLGDERAQENT